MIDPAVRDAGERRHHRTSLASPTAVTSPPCTASVSGIDLPFSSVALLRLLDRTPVRLSELSRRLQVALPPLSRQVRTLEAHGFVERSRGRHRRAGQPAQHHQSRTRCPGPLRRRQPCFARQGARRLGRRVARGAGRADAAPDRRSATGRARRVTEAGQRRRRSSCPPGLTRFRPPSATQGPWDPGAMHGGPPAALVATLLTPAALSELSPTLRLARLTSTSWAALPLGELTAEVTIPRPGKRVALLEATLSAGGRVGPDRPRLVHQCRRVPRRIPRGSWPATPARRRSAAAGCPAAAAPRAAAAFLQRRASSSATGKPTNGASRQAVSTSWVPAASGAARASRSSTASPSPGCNAC